MTTAVTGNIKTNSAITSFTVRLSHGKQMTYILRPRCLLSRLTALLLFFAGIVPVYALPPNALPTGGNVVSGTTSISSGGNTMNINQNSASTIINWGTFNIGSAATVNFRQPSETSVALNRVAIGGGASEIAGHLNANGQVFLVNPNGILFSKTAQVDVGGLVASTLGISNSDFNAPGAKVFTRGATAGSITNLGNIKANEEGYVVLLAPTVSNQGTISARLGTVAMAGGDKITLSFDEEQLINLTVNKATIDTLIENKNVIRANGGLILLTAGAANSLASAVVNNEGLLQAQSVSNNNGVIRLEAAGTNSTVTLSGEIKAPDGNAFAKASTVTVAGDTLVNAANLTLNAKDSLFINAVLDLGGTATNLGLVAGSNGIDGNTGVVRMGSGTLSIYTDGFATLATENLGKLAGFDSNANSAITIYNTGGDVNISSGTILLDPNNSGTRYEISGFDKTRYFVDNNQHNKKTNQGGLTLLNIGGGNVTVSEKITSSQDVVILADSGSIAVNKAINAGNFLALGSGGDINVNARLDGDSIQIDAGGTANFSAQAQVESHGTVAPQDNPNDTLIVATQVFNNQRGADLFTTQPGTRWLVYSADPAANTKGGLLADFKRYDCVFGSCSTVPLTGNGFLYSIAPELIITPDGVHAIYGNSHSLTGLGYTANGFIDGDTLADLTGTATFASSSPLTNRTHVGSYDISYSTGLATNLGYKIVDNTLSAGEYVIDPRVLNISAVAANKVYDGTTLASATLADDRISGDVLSSSFSSASFADKNAGSGKTITVSGIGISGADAGNYVVATNTADHSVATTSADVAQATLHVSATAANKVYDGTMLASATLADDRVTGDVLSSSFSNAGFADKNAGSGKVVTVSGIGISGTDAGNYVVATNTANPAVATTSADIAQATLNVFGATGVTKNFDNTSALPVSAGQGFTVAGLIGSDKLDVTAGAAYDNSLPGARTVVISGATATGVDAGNYFLRVSNGSGAIVQPPDLTSATPQAGSLLAPPAPPVSLASFVNSLPPTAAGPSTEKRDECQDNEIISPLITVTRCGVKREDE